MTVDANTIALVQGIVYVSGGCAIGFGAIGSGVGEGYTAREAALGMARQPKISGEVMRTMLVGQAISESPGIFALIVAFLLILTTGPITAAEATLPFAMAMLGCGLAAGLSGIGAGTGTGLASGEACKSIARNPDCAGKVTVTMLLGQALATSPAVFGFVAALLLILFRGEYSVSGVPYIPYAAALLGGGICMGAGAIGPGLGIGFVGAKACKGVGGNPRVNSAINKTLLIGAAVAESTSIYAFVVFILLVLLVGKQ